MKKYHLTFRSIAKTLTNEWKELFAIEVYAWNDRDAYDAGSLLINNENNQQLDIQCIVKEIIP